MTDALINRFLEIIQEVRGGAETDREKELLDEVERLVDQIDETETLSESNEDRGRIIRAFALYNPEKDALDILDSYGKPPQMKGGDCLMIADFDEQRKLLLHSGRAEFDILDGVLGRQMFGEEPSTWEKVEFDPKIQKEIEKTRISLKDIKNITTPKTHDETMERFKDIRYIKEVCIGEPGEIHVVTAHGCGSVEIEYTELNLTSIRHRRTTERVLLVKGELGELVKMLKRNYPIVRVDGERV